LFHVIVVLFLFYDIKKKKNKTFCFSGSVSTVAVLFEYHVKLIDRAKRVELILARSKVDQSNLISIERIF